MLNSLRICAKLAVFLCFVLSFAHADPVAGCNYTYSVGPYEDRGSVEIIKTTQGLSLKEIQDDQVVIFNKLTVGIRQWRSGPGSHETRRKLQSLRGS